MERAIPFIKEEEEPEEEAEEEEGAEAEQTKVSEPVVEGDEDGEKNNEVTEQLLEESSDGEDQLAWLENAPSSAWYARGREGADGQAGVGLHWETWSDQVLRQGICPAEVAGDAGQGARGTASLCFGLQGHKWYASFITTLSITIHFPTAHKFWVLGGQHSAWAARELGKERMKRERDAAKWMTTVRADVLKANVPVDERKKLAGLQQAQQESVRHLRVSDLARHLESRPGELGLRANLVWAVQVAGKRQGGAVCTPVSASYLILLLSYRIQQSSCGFPWGNWCTSVGQWQ